MTKRSSPKRNTPTEAETLRDADMSTLWRADELRRNFDAGIFPTGAGQHRHFARLERIGLLQFEGWGYDLDRERDGDVPIYRLTEKAMLALAVRRSA